jgi:hypothetical protein
MPESPAFFIPGVAPETEEAVYAQLAQICRSGVPDFDRRLYSITYVHDGVQWTTTVGKQLKGIGSKIIRRRGKRVEQTASHSDFATVLAIFPGVPYTVFTDGFRTLWANPFYAGEPRHATYFSPKTRVAGRVSDKV